jgi:hypothetical protein
MGKKKKAKPKKQPKPKKVEHPPLTPEEIKKYYGDLDTVTQIKQEKGWQLKTIKGRKLFATNLTFVHHERLVLLEVNREMFLFDKVKLRSVL